MVKFQ